MSANQSQDRPLAEVRAKLARAGETLGLLEGEITTFLRDGPGPMTFNGDVDLFAQQVKAHTDRAVPRRLSILAGEVVHHLRSCLDYIVWELTASQLKPRRSARIEFPVFEREPADKNTRKIFDAKVAGIPDRAREMIERLQPYHAPNTVLNGPLNHPLMLIHDLDRIDKHRQLSIAVCGFSITTSGQAGSYIMWMRYASATESEIGTLAPKLDPEGRIRPEVAFLEFGGRRIEPVVPGLRRLVRYVSELVDLFEHECFSS